MTTPSILSRSWFNRCKREFYRIPFQQMMAVAAMIALVRLPAAGAQNAAGGLPPELVPLAAKYQSDLDAHAQTRSKAVAALNQAYLAALDTAGQKATDEGKLDELKAVTEEKEAVTSGRALPSLAAPLLPHELATPRAYLRRETARAEHEYTVHAQQAAVDYLRALAFYENKARMANQTDLVQQIEAEKLKLAGQNPAGPGSAPIAARDVVVNGDFALKKEDGTPLNWTSGGPGKGAVSTEEGTTFLRVVSRDKKETWLLENIERPAGAQELRVTARLRCRDVKVQGECGVIIAQRNGENNLLVRDHPCILSAPSPGWRTLSGIVKILPETKRLIIRCNMVNSMNTVDFADVRVEAR
jgi:hypothetical protein